MRAILFSVLILASLAACGNPDKPLRNLDTTDGGPDEFSVVPSRALEMPNAATLPVPTPGGVNLADVTPKADAIIALGGNPAAQYTGGVPATDAALVAHATRNGVETDIRGELAARDDALRERRKGANVFNPLNRDRYFPTYANQALDADAELARLIALGVAVPNAPAAE